MNTNLKVTPSTRHCSQNHIFELAQIKLHVGEESGPSARYLPVQTVDHTHSPFATETGLPLTLVYEAKWLPIAECQ